MPEQSLLGDALGDPAERFGPDPRQPATLFALAADGAGVASFPLGLSQHLAKPLAHAANEAATGLLLFLGLRQVQLLGLSVVRHLAVQFVSLSAHGNEVHIHVTKFRLKNPARACRASTPNGSTIASGVPFRRGDILSCWSAKMPSMLRRLLIPFLLAMGAYTDMAAQESVPAALTLELRIFNGPEEVTSHTRVTVHRAGERESPLVQTQAAAGRVELKVSEGIYDVQAIYERDGQVLNIRWANRLVVMPYPDEGGRHLEVVNFKSGFGALQVRGTDGAQPDVSLYTPGNRDKAAAIAPVPGQDAAGVTDAGYVLFVVPAGTYDLQIKTGGKSEWHTGVDVPLDRTRLWVRDVRS
jgi:hypothetical protein